MKSKKIILPFFFLLFLTYSILSIFHSAIAFNWTFQDWAINYEGGFVRRGLSGEFIFYLSKLIFENNIQFYFGVPINLTYFYLLSLFCLIFYGLLYKLLKNIDLNFENFFIILSPLSLSFFVYNTGAIGRKEILLFIIFLSFIYLIKFLKRRENSIFLILFSFPLIILIHEGMIFFTSIFLILYFLSINPKNLKFSIICIYCFLFLCLLTFITTAIYKGNTSQVEAICINLNYVKNCNGLSAIGMLSDEHTLSFEIKVLWERILKDKYLLYYPACAILGFYPLYRYSSKYYFNIVIKSKKIKINFSILFIILFINSLPLYIFTHDWGRWLNITYILLMITFYYLKDAEILFLPNKDKFYLFFYKPDYIKKFILTLGLLFYSIGINISYFGGYANWINNYNMMDDKLKFYLKVIKTLPHLF